MTSHAVTGVEFRAPVGSGCWFVRYSARGFEAAKHPPVRCHFGEGGNVAELEKEAHIDPNSLWAGTTRFANDRTMRLKVLVHPDAR